MANYPLGFFPDHLQAETAIPVQPTKPHPPTEPQRKANPEKPSRFLSPYLMLAGVAIMFLASTKKNDAAGIAIIGAVMFVASAWSSIGYSSSKSAYELETARNEADFQRQQADYSLRLIPNYKAQLAEWEKKCQELSKEDYIFWYRVDLLKTGLQKVSAPVASTKTYKIGKSEQAFGEHLKARFGSSVLTGFVPAEATRDYLPDFVIYEPVMGYCFAIEVDEPYDLEFGDPIHYIGSDVARTRYFMDKGWVIIRFAEQQVVQQPEACCDVIAWQINKVTLGLARLLVTGEGAKLKPVKHWTKEEAVQMEARSFRESYLGLPTQVNDLFTTQEFRESWRSRRAMEAEREEAKRKGVAPRRVYLTISDADEEYDRRDKHTSRQRQKPPQPLPPEIDNDLPF